MKKNNSKKKNNSFFKKLVPLAEKAYSTFKDFVSKNPVLIAGLSLGPVIAISQSLKAGVSLSVAFSIIVVPVFVILGCIPVKLSKSLRVILCCLLSAIFFVPAFWFAKTIFPEVNDKVGVFLPLMVVNPIISNRSSETMKGFLPITSLKNGLKTALGFSLVMCIVSAIREILGSGSLWGAPIGNLRGNVSFLLPFMGFIILGFLAACARKFADISIKADKEGEK